MLLIIVIKYLLIDLKIIYVLIVKDLLIMVIWRLGRRMFPLRGTPFGR
nr:MAG TPA: hypothetical protein [Crassvirales sp.]